MVRLNGAAVGKDVIIMRTKKQTKELMIEVWSYIVKHEIYTKEHLPSKLFNKIRKSLNKCPLCDLYLHPVTDVKRACEGCPLGMAGQRCLDPATYHLIWVRCHDINGAKGILEIVKGWEV